MKETKQQPSAFRPWQATRNIYRHSRRMVDSIKRTASYFLGLAALGVGFVYINQDKHESFRDIVQWGEHQVESTIAKVKAHPWMSGREDEVDRLVSDFEKRVKVQEVDLRSRTR